MSKKIITLLLLLFISVNIHAEVDFSWLVDQQNLDGGFSAQNDIGFKLQNTSEALQTLYALDGIGLIDENLSLQIIDDSDPVHLENIVRKIFANKNAGHNVDSLVNQLKLFINVDGGFGSIAGYQSAILDTALAMLALGASVSLFDDDYSYAVSFLINRQNIDGSWSSTSNASSIYITAVASLALQKAQAVYDVSGNVSAANTFLINHARSNLTSVDTFELAQIVLAVAPATSDKPTYQFLLDQLNSTREIDGSWSQDIYTTALAMHALHLGELDVPVNEDLTSVANPSSIISAITGVVTDNVTGQALSGAYVGVITSDSVNTNVPTGADGRYVISNLAPGDANITITHAGYHSTNATPILSAGVVHHFNPILIQQPLPTVVTVYGNIIDLDSNLPLMGVSVQVVNSNISTQTDINGDFNLTALSPGSITVQISKVGSVSSFFVISAPSGGEVDLGLITLKAGATTDNFGLVKGIIVDAISGEGLNGVAVSLSGADNKSTFTGADGRFVIKDVNPGSVNITAILTGYNNAVSNTDIVAGVSTQFNALLVKANDQAQVTIKGIVIDAQTQEALSGVSIHIADQELTTLSLIDGRFLLGNIASGSFDVTLSLNGYYDTTYSVTVDGGAVINMDNVVLFSSSVDGTITNLIVMSTVNGLFGSSPAGLPLTRSVDLVAGQSVTIVASGMISLPITSADPDGYSQAVNAASFYFPLEEKAALDGVLFPRSEPVVLEKIGALFGAFVNRERVDSPDFQAINILSGGDVEASSIFFAGVGPTVYTASESGTLFFGVNDWYSINNEGQFNVTVETDQSTGIPDLIVDQLTVDSILTNIQSLQISGSTQIRIKNIGMASADMPATVTVFEDVNANGIFDIVSDNILGSISMPFGLASNGTLDIALPLYGFVAFRDSPIYAMIDSKDMIAEIDESNNVNNSLYLCREITSASSLADITTSVLKLNSNEEQPASISVRIGNGGELSIAQAVNVNFYEGDPSVFGVLLGTITLDNLAAGSYQDITLNNIPALTGNNDIVVVADTENSIQECNELNNTMSLSVFAGSVLATLTVETSATQYAAGSEILLQGSAMNDSAIPGQFLVQLHIEDVEGNLIQSFPQHNTEMISGKTSVNVNDIWNSEGFLTGVYQLRGELVDLQGQLLSTSTQSFSLTSTAGATIASLRTNTDKAKYHTSDLVQIDNLIVNLSNDTVINDAQLHITITNSANDIVFTQTDSLSSIGRDSNRQRGVNYNFTNESEGSYWVNAQLFSSQSTVLASAYTGYIIESDAVQTIVGSTNVESLSLDIGQQQLCTDNVQNIGDTDFASLAIEQVLIDVINQQVVQTSDQVVSLSAKDSQTFIRNVSTSSLTTGDYICALHANINGSLHTLDFAVFKVNEPPIHVEGNLNTGPRGQLLIWFEAQDVVAEEDEKHQDSVDYNNDLIVQRQYLENLLNEAGWSYTLVENRDDFVAEFSSGQYQAYLLFNGKEKLGKLLEAALREAVNRGEGLIVTSRNDYQGHHESWLSDTGNNNALAEAFGIRVRDQHENVLDFNFVLDNPLSLDGTITFNETKHAVGLELNQAQAVLEYTLASYLDDEQKLYNTVVSYNQYGHGRALYAGFDVLAYATKYQDKALLKDLINQALDKTHPEDLLLSPSSVVPVEVNIVNLGSDAVLQTRLIAPIDSIWLRATDGSISNPEVVWQYSALAGSDRDITAWVQIPEAGGHVPIELLIKAGIDADNFIDQDSKVLSIFANTPVMLADIIVQIEDLRVKGYEQQTLKSALSQLEKALKQEQAGKLDHANEDAIKATDELKDETDQAIIDVRLQIDVWLRLSTIRDTGLWFRYLDE